MPINTKKYESCNHYHELTKEHEMVDFGDGEFVANKMAIPLLKALNELGLKTRTHHIDKEGGFFSILLDNIDVEIKKVKEYKREKYNGKDEVLISWNKSRLNKKIYGK